MPQNVEKHDAPIQFDTEKFKFDNFLQSDESDNINSIVSDIEFGEKIAYHYLNMESKYFFRFQLCSL